MCIKMHKVPGCNRILKFSCFGRNPNLNLSPMPKMRYLFLSPLSHFGQFVYLACHAVFCLFFSVGVKSFPLFVRHPNNVKTTNLNFMELGGEGEKNVIWCLNSFYLFIFTVCIPVVIRTGCISRPAQLNPFCRLVRL